MILDGDNVTFVSAKNKTRRRRRRRRRTTTRSSGFSGLCTCT
jgi:hypothetical protein